jgi:glucan biosynthesis protein C
MRRTDLDLLRILFCASVVCAHALLIFAFEPRYHLKSPDVSFVASVLYEFIRVTTMPAFMLIAGWSAVKSLRSRSPAQFMWERGKRLLVPLIFGMVTFGSVIKFIELRDGRDLSVAGLAPPLFTPTGFGEFYIRYISHSNLVTWSHLWFLAYLFVFSIVLLPVLMALAHRRPSMQVPSAAVVYLPALILVASLLTLHGYWPFLPRLVGDVGNLALFGLSFLAGAVIAIWPGFEERLRSQAPFLMALTLVAFVGLVACGESVAGRIFVGLTAWGGAGSALALASRFSPRASPTLAWLSDAALPVYILHHLPLLLIALAVLPLALPMALKIVIIWLGATAVSLAAYQWLVRPWPPMRFLMGMPARATAAPRPSLAAAPTAL